MKKITKEYIESLLGEPTSIYGKFHQQTKLTTKQKTEFKEEKNTNSKRKLKDAKEYPRLEKYVLPDTPQWGNKSFEQVINNRKTTRHFSKKSITLDQISYVLKKSMGQKKDFTRYYPSAGDKYPLETYIITKNCELPPAIYHYHLQSHTLEKIAELGNFKAKDYILESWAENAAIYIIITAVFNRNVTKYGDRGYRAILQEVGYLGQLIYQTSVISKLGCSAIGGFLDQKFEKLLDIDGVNESMVGLFVLGNEKEKTSIV